MNCTISGLILGILFLAAIDFSSGGRANLIDIYRKEVFDYAVLRSRLPVVVYFTKSSCIPCRRGIQPKLEDIAKKNADKMYLAIVDLDKLPKLKDYFGINEIPTTRGYFQGQMVGEVEGPMKLSIQDLAEKTLQLK